jgi:nucleoside-diphosphate-sugar epimerase
MMAMAVRFNVRRMVFGSSLSVYGSCAPDRVISESDRAAPEDVYGAAKLYVEQLGLAYAVSQGLEFVSLRIGRVVAPGAQSATSAWRSQIFEFLHADHAVDINLPYMGTERVLLVHRDDVARATDWLPVQAEAKLRPALGRREHGVESVPRETFLSTLAFSFCECSTLMDSLAVAR